MQRAWTILFLSCTLAANLNAQQTSPALQATEDPYLWLEDVMGDKALAWARERNAETMKDLGGSPAFRKLKTDLIQIYDSKAQIPYVTKYGPYYYNYWQDADNPQGIWRRTSPEEYRKAEPKWEVILDLDALGKAERVNWVWNEAQVLKEGGYRRCLVSLSRGGADASVVREFDIESRSFVKDGFQLPETKGALSWSGMNTVYVWTDFGPGTLSTSGYPRILKRWKRGTPLAQADLVYESPASDVGVVAYANDTKGFERDFVLHSLTTYTSELYLRDKEGKLHKIDIPLDAKGSDYREWLLVELRSPWTVKGKTYPAGALLASPFDAFINGKRELTVLFEPTATTSLAGYNWTRHHLILDVLENVQSRLVLLKPGKGEWTRAPFQGAPPLSTVSAWGIDPEESDEFMMDVNGFLNPAGLFYGRIGQQPEKLKQQPAYFEASGFEVSQHFATSKDGTKIPYFQVSRKDLPPSSMNPTLLYGYGGFEDCEVPFYSGGLGRAWLSQGGVYVLANIRGGGEYGPRWHQAALKQNRLRAYEDFAAVAEDLIARKITNTKHLGAMGGSNGGLLMGNMLTLYPQLIGAIVCQAPLLDMKRYSHLLAGASWMEEYGDPDKPDEWAFIQTFSPYHNLKKGQSYPSIIFTTSTRDDRVHPGHARKMAAKMRDLGLDVRYYENIEGGHGGSANNEQRAHMSALEYTFLWQKLK